MITLEDVLTKTPEEIIKQISVQNEQEPEEDEEVDYKKELEHVKLNLKGFFKGDPTKIKRGEVLHVEEHFIKITGVVPSTDRVFFNFYNKPFSLSIAYLVGKNRSDFPFKKGDLIRYDNVEYLIHGCYPSSKHVSIKVEDKIKKLKIDEVEKC